MSRPHHLWVQGAGYIGLERVIWLRDRRFREAEEVGCVRFGPVSWQDDGQRHLRRSCLQQEEREQVVIEVEEAQLHMREGEQIDLREWLALDAYGRVGSLRT